MKRSPRQVWLKLMLLVAAAVAMGACSTMEGLGKDVQKLGDKIEDKAAN